MAEIEGFDDTLRFLEANVTDSVCPGICTNEGCDYTCEVEPDSREGYCENCGTNTVTSGMILGGII